MGRPDPGCGARVDRRTGPENIPPTRQRGEPDRVRRQPCPLLRRDLRLAVGVGDGGGPTSGTVGVLGHHGEPGGAVGDRGRRGSGQPDTGLLDRREHRGSPRSAALPPGRAGGVLGGITGTVSAALFVLRQIGHQHGLPGLRQGRRPGFPGGRGHPPDQRTDGHRTRRPGAPGRRGPDDPARRRRCDRGVRGR